MLKFESLADVKEYVKAFKKTENKMYPLPFKVALIDYILDTNISIKRIAKVAEVSQAAIYSWRSQFENNSQDDSQAKTTSIISELNNQILDIKNQINIIEHLQGLGYIVTRGNK